MNAPGRPKRELLPLGGKARSAKGAPLSALGLSRPVTAPGTLRVRFDDVHHPRDISRTLRFRNGDVSDLRSRLAEQQRNVVTPVRVLDVVDSHADTPRWRLRLVEQARNHQRMGLFVANRRAIFAVAR